MFFSSPSGIQHFVIFAAQPYGLPLKEVTIAQYLKALGYKTHAVGKVSSLTSSFADVVTTPRSKSKYSCGRNPVKSQSFCCVCFVVKGNK